MYFPPLYDFLNNSFFPPAYFIVRIQNIIHMTYKIYVNQLLMLLVRLPVNNRLLVVKFCGDSNVILGLSKYKMAGGVLFKSKLHLVVIVLLCYCLISYYDQFIN